ncbi:oligopeptide transport superfamily ATP-binding protein [Candidatus Gastranaerophilus sp. (ex Termes propinquus)]|nr:oligopeptide transport superfamily ATP-binding protein [Candidatus Gastranaerophilus sp. (ex Termes propinquus)]
MQNLVEVKNLVKTYRSDGGFLMGEPQEVYAVRDVSLEIKKGEILGLVGESGCGKSTLGNCILKLLDVTSGEIYFNGENILKYNSKQTKAFRQKAQLIFQNPYASLNPKMRIGEILKEPLVINGIRKKDEQNMRLEEVLGFVSLSKNDLKRYPHEFSGGQRQRIAIARALILKPEFIVADEPISALDVSIQAQIINLLIELKEHFDLTYLFISHDLNVVRYLCTRVAIMYKGEIVELGDTEDIFTNPGHPYTKTLLEAIPLINF